MCLKIEEQRADLLGTRAPASLRIDPVQLMEQAQPQKTSTERILEALNRIAAEPKNGDPLADKSIRMIGNNANGAPPGGEPDPELAPKSGLPGLPPSGIRAATTAARKNRPQHPNTNGGGGSSAPRSP
jgi:hypothetical protein